MAKSDGFVDGQTLIALVDNTAPWLERRQVESATLGVLAGSGAHGYLDVLSAARARAVEASEEALSSREGLLDYFALCLAAHHATVATFVPTDVDTKIRGLLWRRVRDEESMAAFLNVASAFCTWDVPAVSRRFVVVEELGCFSGHDGERLSVLVAALGRAMQLDLREHAEAARSLVAAELEREERAFERLERRGGDGELDLMRLASIMTHNAGDIDQALSFWPKSEAHREESARLGRLAHENTSPLRGAFARAARIYKATLSPEGHRNYPLRAVRALRASPDFMIEIAPFLDDWGARLASSHYFEDGDRAELVEALVLGCRKLEGQRGYFRALVGMQEALGGRFEEISRKLPAAVRADLKSTEMRKALSVKRVSFESSMRALLRKVR